MNQRAQELRPEPRVRPTHGVHYLGTVSSEPTVRDGALTPPLLLKLVFGRVESAPMPFFVKPVARAIVGRAMTSFIDPQIKLHLDFMEGELGKSTWFAGDDFTAADVQMSFPLEAAASRGGLDASRPRLMGFLDSIHTRPAYKKALERGGPYELLR